MTGRAPMIVALLTLGLGASAGCQSPGPLLSRQTTIGTLKASVSQLEYKNDQLEKQVANLKSENRRLDDRLVQEQAENDDLATRLDDTRALLGDRGMELRTGSRSKAGSDDLDDPPPSPARRTKSRRKPPAAAIPGRIEPADDGDGLGQGDIPPWRAKLASRRPTDERWLPVAQGSAGDKPVVK